MAQSELEILLRDVPPAASAGGVKPRARRAARPKPAPPGGMPELLADVPAADPGVRPRAAATRSPAPDLSDPTGPASGLEGFASSHGFTVTSTTGGRHNPGSLHPRGLAADVRTKDKTAEEVEAFMEKARAAGYRVRDERTRPAGQAEWDGEHVHLEGYDDGALGELLADVAGDDSPLAALHDESRGTNRVRETAAAPDPAAPATIRRKVGGESVTMTPAAALEEARGARSLDRFAQPAVTRDGSDEPRGGAPDEPFLDPGLHGAGIFSDPPAVLGGVVRQMPVEADDERIPQVLSRPALSRGDFKTHGPAPVAPAPDIHTAEGRAERDALAEFRARPGARSAVTVGLPSGRRDWADVTPDELMRHALGAAARERNVPDEYAEEWMRGHPDALKLVDRATGQPATLYDVIASDAYDSERRTLSLSLQSVYDMERDYMKSRGAGTRFVDWATSDETTAGEKFLDVGDAGLEGAARVGKTLSTASAAAMRAPSTMIAAAVDSGDARARIASGMYAPERQIGAVLHTAMTGETPEGYEQPIAEIADLNYQLEHGEKLPGWRRALLEVLGDPATVGMAKLPTFPLTRGAVGLARRSSVGRALLGTGDAGKLARAEALFARGGRIIDIEAAPVAAAARAAGDAVEGAADDAAEFVITVRDADGKVHRVDTATGEVMDDADARLAPELPETIAAQLDALRRGARGVVLVTPGAEVPSVLPRGMKSVATPEGVAVYNPKVAGKDEIRRRAHDGTLGELMGHVERKSPAATEVVVARDPTSGVELQSSYTSPANVGAQSDVFARQYPGAHVETGGPELEARVLSERGAGGQPRTAEEFFDQAVAEAKPKPAASAPPAAADPLDALRVEVPDPLDALRAETPDPLDALRADVPDAPTAKAPADVPPAAPPKPRPVEGPPDLETMAREADDRASRLDFLAHKEGVDPEFAARVRGEAEAARRDAAALRDGEAAFPDPPARFNVTREPKGTRAPATGNPVARGARAVADVLQIPKALRASFDFSAFGRQAWPQLLAHPTYIRDALRNTGRAVVSADDFDAFARSIPDLPDYERMREAGLFLSSMKGQREEVFASAAAERIPGVGASSRAASATNDTVRLLAWDNYVDHLAAHGADNPEALKAVANLINVTTGRGKVPILDRFDVGRKIVDASNVLFFSPRAMASRFNLLSPTMLVQNALNPATRRVAYLQARDGFRALSTLGLTLALVDQVPGVDVGFDPSRPDFGKVRIGTAVFDTTGGVAHSAKFLAKLARSFAGGDSRGGRPADSPLDVTAEYLRTQLGPSAAVGVDWATGETVRGEEFTKLGAARDLALPMTAQTFHDAWTDAGGTSAPDAVRKLYYGTGPEGETAFLGALRGLPGVGGVGVNFYEKPKDYEAEREAARIKVSGRAGEEIARLGIDLNFDPPGDERADKDEGEFAPPPRTVGSVVDGSVSFSDPEDERGNLGQTPEHLDAMRRKYEAQIAETVAAEISKPGYAMFRDDAARKQYLGNVIQTVKNGVLAEFRRDTRGREIEVLGELKKQHKELEERKPPPDWMKQPAPTPTPSPSPVPPDPDDLEGLLRDVPDADPPGADDAPEWEEFSDDSGSLKVPRAAMPQIKSEHRGALVQFLKGRGVAHRQESVPANTLKPSQAEFSPAKVAKARGFEGPSRSILVSSDNHVVDGHHQWMASLTDAPAEDIPVIRLDAPIQQLLIEVARFPSSGVDARSKRGG